MRLSPRTLADLPADVARPLYDRDREAVGIVHFGIGAFHRAHQAYYSDAAMNLGDRGWAITGVSLRSAGVARQMNPQAGLYTLAERSDGATSLRIVGSVRNVLVAADTPDAVVAAVAAPSTHIVSLTVTEKGYCRDAQGGLDFDLAHSLSFYHFVAQGLLRRRAAGLPGVTLLSCDNLADNGRQLEALMRQYLERHEPALVQWFGTECSCPSTMVDRIVPATAASDRAIVGEQLGGLTDEACVVTEPFSQWVIEDRFAGPRPKWDAVGAELVTRVAPYERAKLRMLNGAHSLLAYCGLAAGHDHVHEAVADPGLRALAERLMRDEAAPTIAAAPDQYLDAYARALTLRFANPALNHRLSQIATDGSQKIPQRWLETLMVATVAGQRCDAILAGLRAWIEHLRGISGPVADSMADKLIPIARDHDPEGAIRQIFGHGGLLPGEWSVSIDALAPEIGSVTRRAGHGDEAIPRPFFVR